MHRYVAGRLLATIPTLLGVVTLVFVVMRLVPGSIVDQLLASGDASEEVRRSLRAVFGNTPLDHVVRILSLFSLSMPVFWQATMLILVLSLTVRWAPLGYVDPF